ncbi:MAG TPA: DUF1003 domain-containing protein [Acidobacteriaceae bacterium]|jgi:uncharacterized membrane protein|nr:DUF1003 domain-containing protein [Acidobacteriaceae bacterium]
MSDGREQRGSTVESNIDSVADLERAFEQKRDFVDRIADAIGGFSGSMGFVGLHVAWFTVWFLINTGVIPGVKRFDPYPFILLAMIVSVEGVLLSTFVLMKQNRMQQKTDIRDHLNLQIDLLAEKEITKALQLLRAIASKMDIEQGTTDVELEEMANTTSVDRLAERISVSIEDEKKN